MVPSSPAIPVMALRLPVCTPDRRHDVERQAGCAYGRSISGSRNRQERVNVPKILFYFRGGNRPAFTQRTYVRASDDDLELPPDAPSPVPLDP